MAWVTPITWTIGQLVEASDLNEQLRDNLGHLKIPVDDSGKIPAISATYFASVDGSGLSNVVKTGVDNDFTAGVHNFGAGAGARFALPVGSDKWAL